ncbi:helix-turn-helix domain-containing protein, partial [Cloacibacillus porcorum]
MRKRKTEERIRAIEMHKQGIPRRRIAEELGVSPDSVKTWISLYKSGQKDLLDD